MVRPWTQAQSLVLGQRQQSVLFCKISFFILYATIILESTASICVTKSISVSHISNCSLMLIVVNTIRQASYILLERTGQERLESFNVSQILWTESLKFEPHPFTGVAKQRQY